MLFTALTYQNNSDLKEVSIVLRGMSGQGFGSSFVLVKSNADEIQGCNKKIQNALDYFNVRPASSIWTY